LTTKTPRILKATKTPRILKATKPPRIPKNECQTLDPDPKLGQGGGQRLEFSDAQGAAHGGTVQNCGPFVNFEFTCKPGEDCQIVTMNAGSLLVHRLVIHRNRFLALSVALSAAVPAHSPSPLSSCRIVGLVRHSDECWFSSQSLGSVHVSAAYLIAMLFLTPDCALFPHSDERDKGQTGGPGSNASTKGDCCQ